MLMYEVKHHVENKDGESYSEVCKSGSLASVRNYLLEKYDNIDTNNYTYLGKTLTMFESNGDMVLRLEYKDRFETHTYDAYFVGEF